MHILIRVLHIVPALDGGGVENLLLNYYSHMNKDKFVFDFIVHGKNVGALESVFEKMGSKIYHIPPKHESFLQNLKAMQRIINDGNYDVVHAHQGAIGTFPMYFAKKAGVRCRITHSHVAFMRESLLRKIINKFLLIFLKKYATDWFACGTDAGRFLWGDNAVNNGKVHVMNNAIEIDKFTFNPLIREEMRHQLDVDGKFVIGNVGRLSYQKNHEFLIRVFNEIYKLEKNGVLLLVGRGELEDDVRQQVEELGLTEAVKFLGIRNDVPSLLQAMDVFLLPSRYEGLPVVLVEAQAAGLVSVVADTITKEVKVTDKVIYISLEESYLGWANEVLMFTNGYERKDTFPQMQLGGYDILQEAKKMELFYANHQTKDYLPPMN